MLKDRRTYEIMRPEDVGVPATTLVLGKHSGRHALQHRLASLGVEVTRLELDRLYRRMIALADAQKTVSDPELLQLVELQRTSAHADPHVVVRDSHATTRPRKKSDTGTASDRVTAYCSPLHHPSLTTCILPIVVCVVGPLGVRVLARGRADVMALTGSGG